MALENDSTGWKGQYRILRLYLSITTTIALKDQKRKEKKVSLLWLQSFFLIWFTKFIRLMRHLAPGSDMPVVTEMPLNLGFLSSSGGYNTCQNYSFVKGLGGIRVFKAEVLKLRSMALSLQIQEPLKLYTKLCGCVYNSVFFFFKHKCP